MIVRQEVLAKAVERAQVDEETRGGQRRVERKDALVFEHRVVLRRHLDAAQLGAGLLDFRLGVGVEGRGGRSRRAAACERREVQ